MPLSKRLLGLVFLALAAPCGYAQSEIFMCQDEGGRKEYTNVKRDTVGRNCRQVSKEVSVVPAQTAPSRVSPPPGVGPSAALSRAESRRKILEAELQNEEKLLIDAQKKLGEQEAIRSGDERNYARVLERLKPYQESVDQHQKNIDQLKLEIAKLK